MRRSTIIRSNMVHEIHSSIKQRYDSNVFNNLSKTFIYEEIHKETGLCTKTIANILNHSSPKEILSE